MRAPCLARSRTAYPDRMRLNPASPGASLHSALSRGGGGMGSAVGDVDDIDFDDLTSPRLTDVQRRILEFTEAKRVEFDIERMLAEAVEAAGVGDDLNDTDGLADRLTAHVAAIEGDEGLTQLTRASLRQRVVRLLRNRLSLTELIKRYPEIESIPIYKPFIAAGAPRAG